MRGGKGIMFIGIGAVVTLAVVIPLVALSFQPLVPKSDAMMGPNFYAIRREALTLFPRGSRLPGVADGLVKIGFRCTSVSHKVPNVNAESLVCESHGRGYPSSPALTVTIFARNGLLSDIEVWNMLDKADAESLPPPPPVVTAAAPAEESAHGKPAHGE